MLCSAGVGYDPVIDRERTTFAVEGSWRGTLTLYDEASRSLWLQLTGACIDGPRRGVVLRPLGDARHTRWRDWRTRHPDTEVMDRDPRNLRGTDDYLTPRAARSGSPHVPEEVRAVLRLEDRRLEPSALVYGVALGGEARAYPFSLLTAVPVLTERLGGRGVTVWFDPAVRSAAAFDPAVADRTLSFRAAEDGAITDVQTGSLWSPDGRCEAGPLEGARLQRVPGLTCEWYGWVAAHTRTTIWSP